eukprot:1092734-Rhodomonas_salina.2
MSCVRCVRPVAPYDAGCVCKLNVRASVSRGTPELDIRWVWSFWCDPRAGTDRDSVQDCEAPLESALSVCHIARVCARTAAIEGTV